ncbi:PLP-dependent aminotransferase family protein [Klebsiella aerogenes]|uniref:GntR family transcriptional regulator with n=1 Tax=Klebsiella aerogenes (strain ATCC 13048 / DSM 30053 / CCUG 1429 / JCM 1235 / KCTC 2190 / NBRC 13534 / NCIMB 10102 / NCTC 10006 / CDC 819-56) TaxID=1028307 RepID=A0A0H3FT88_KLEAK|nr:PLP-dependent aminotransferase family protein [Klebsiella aerogenes]AEG98938.1 GntR family transcriptional regulator with [Klebsiella aerogenes KCTC 2190]EIV2481678.1 PLP-dependent aminotransferase family protein [Klebsiella aerogenes]EJC6253073.1 PLP-dependent aminotransferase family protein [Klebsiella aerogenes]EJL5445257.1 PLP-dependent aminotransferase family protein [Klebsiella aerogenes]EKJ9781156.1 PLP-dependent aminotransferase family protein [Klebsiella aerogenes]
MKKYQQLAQQLTDQIALGVWQPGDRLPSLREQVVSSGMSFMTVSHAYQLLESQGRIIARPQSGYYVAPQPVKQRQPDPPAQVTRNESVDINTYIFDVLQASRQASMLPFASAFPDPRLFPLQQLNRSLAQVSKTATAMSVIENLPPGNDELRHAIARRYALQGMNVSPDEIVITAGALEALNLSLQAVTEPGDWVVVENPCFYGALQALERLRLKALSVASDVKEGIDLAALEQALQNYPVKACWLMTNSQNPLGFTLTAEKKAQLVALLTHYNVMLIEDDVYSELYFGREKPLPAKYWDRDEMTLHCSSFSKCLVPGFRIGWVAAGRHARRIQQLQLMSTLSTSSPMQLALVDYLSTKRYDAHLRRLRRQLAERKQLAWQALLRFLPAEVKIHHSDSGYFLWLELPAGVDAGELSALALRDNISIAPGKMFSTTANWTSFFRFNTAWGWGEKEEQGVKRLGELIRQLLP